MKIIGYQVQSLSNINDEAQYVIDGMLTLIEKALPNNRTTLYISADKDETHFLFDGDEDFNEPMVNIFAIIEADESETLEEAEQNAREPLRALLEDELGLTGQKQEKLF